MPKNNDDLLTLKQPSACSEDTQVSIIISLTDTIVKSSLIT